MHALTRTLNVGSMANSVATSADGTHIVCGSDDHTVKLWDLALGACVRTFEGHKASVLSIGMS